MPEAEQPKPIFNPEIDAEISMLELVAGPSIPVQPKVNRLKAIHKEYCFEPIVVRPSIPITVGGDIAMFGAGWMAFNDLRFAAGSAVVGIAAGAYSRHRHRQEQEDDRQAKVNRISQALRNLGVSPELLSTDGS